MAILGFLLSYLDRCEKDTRNILFWGLGGTKKRDTRKMGEKKSEKNKSYSCKGLVMEIMLKIRIFRFII